MGSFQQIIMGSTCLAAAFFFGSYLHNRPAIDQTVQRSVAPADPMESLLGFGQRPASKPQPAPSKPAPLLNQTAAIDPSELAPVFVSTPMPRQQELSSVQENSLPRKPVVPDFSDLASRFRNTPLELSGAASGNVNLNDSVTGDSAIHASERVQYSGTFKAPEMVIRQPQTLRPLNDFRQAVDQVEQSDPVSVTETQPTSDRWRTVQPERFESFKPLAKPVAPTQVVNRQPRQPRQTIEDVVSRHSTDWLKEPGASQFQSDDQAAQQQQTFATNPPQSEGWNSLQQRQVTQQAAQRHDLLEIEDPGNRFRSMQSDVAYADPPEPDYSTYYKPSADRRDVREETGNRGASSQLRTIQNDRGSQNWGRQSNVDNRYEIKTGDTLQSISTRFYGTPDRYLEIYRANRDVLDRITSSPVGVMIEIPIRWELSEQLLVSPQLC